jgi:DNA-binding response OmpR family regulator
VIDDDPDILKVLKANLELYGYETLLAGTWAAGLHALEQEHPELVVLDRMLPDGEGIDICRSIKAQYPRLPIIMLTAKDRVSDKVAGLECGADDYIVKPFETLELVARVKACLRRNAPLENKTVIGDLVIDTKAHTVSMRGMPIDLTPREYDLLCLFIRHRGEAISREYIRKTLWRSTNIYSWSRVIDVHIQHLRHKLEKDPTAPEYILTVPATGYRFRP